MFVIFYSGFHTINMHQITIHISEEGVKEKKKNKMQ